MNLNAVYVAYGDEHIAMARRSGETVLKQHPDAEIVLYTDKTHPEYFSHPFMLANVMCQTDWLIRNPESQTTVFLDNDTVMANPITELPSADMWVTWRDNVGELSKAQPYNYGVVIAKHSPVTVRAFSWLEQRILKLSPTRQKWYGNQIALRELVGPLTRNETVHRNMVLFELAVHQLPCSKWNWTPPDDKPKQSASDKIFIHCKGDRKDLLNYYYEKVMKDG